MTFVASSEVQKAGELLEGWEKDEHTPHNSDSLKGQISIFQRQLPNTVKAIEQENIEELKNTLEMYKRDRKKLQFDIQNDKISRELFEPLQSYIESLNDWITVLESILNE